MDENDSRRRPHLLLLLHFSEEKKIHLFCTHILNDTVDFKRKPRRRHVDRHLHASFLVKIRLPTREREIPCVKIVF